MMTPPPTKLSYAADSKHGGSNTGGFQPGSSFKPIVLAQWYQRGMSGYTVLGGASHVFTTGDFHASCDPGFAIETGTWITLMLQKTLTTRLLTLLPCR